MRECTSESESESTSTSERERERDCDGWQSVLDAVGGDGRCVTAVAFLEDWELQRLCVHPKLLDGARAERIARAEHRGEAVRLEIVGHLRE